MGRASAQFGVGAAEASACALPRMCRASFPASLRVVDRLLRVRTVTAVNLYEELSALGVSEATISEMEALVDGGVPGKLVLLYAPLGVDGAEVAGAAARESLADPDLRLLDIHVCHPLADRWTVDEVDQRIIAPSRLRPYERAHIIVSDADMMSQALHDHLLKTVEEPTSDAVFWFSAAAGATLPATLRGRATHEIYLQPTPASTAVDRLVGTGADRQQAEAALAAAGGDLALAAAALAHGCQETLSRVGASGWQTDRPTSTADQLLLDLAELATARSLYLSAQAGKKSRKTPAPPTQKGTARRLDAKKLDPADRAQLRRLLRMVFARWRQSIVSDLASTQTRTEMRMIETRLAAVADAHTGLLFNTPLGTVTAAVLARLNA